MNYGLYLSASGVLTNMYRQDVFANNLANVETVGFKRDLAMISQRAAESIEDNVGLDLKDPLLDKLGGGVFAGPQMISFKRGSLELTNNPLDAALEADDTFFAVADTDSRTGQQAIRLTRDGRFSRNGEGYLVLVTNGRQVLDDSDQPIQVPGSGNVSIGADGYVRHNGVNLARLQVTAVADKENLVKQGHNLFAFADGADNRVEATNPNVRPKYVEASTVDPMTELMKLIKATKAVQTNGNLIHYHDLLMDRAVNTLGRVIA